MLGSGTSTTASAVPLQITPVGPSLVLSTAKVRLSDDEINVLNDEKEKTSKTFFHDSVIDKVEESKITSEPIDTITSSSKEMNNEVKV